MSEYLMIQSLGDNSLIVCLKACLNCLMMKMYIHVRDIFSIIKYKMLDFD